jgi:hypothetical protein
MIVPVRHTELYKNDTIGLKTLDESGKLFFYHGPGIHMTLTPEYINAYLIPLLLDEEPTPS